MMNNTYRSMRLLIGPVLILCLTLLFCSGVRAAQDGNMASEHSDTALTVNVSAAQEVYFQRDQGQIPVTVELSGEDTADVSLIKLSFAVNSVNAVMTLAEPAKIEKDGRIRVDFIIRNVLTQENGTVDMPVKIDVLDDQGILKKSETKRIQTNVHIYVMTACMISRDQDLQDQIDRGLKKMVSGNESFAGLKTKVIQTEDLSMLGEIPDLYSFLIIDRTLSGQEAETAERWILGGGHALIERSSHFPEGLTPEKGLVRGYGSGKICFFDSDGYTEEKAAEDIISLCTNVLYDEYYGTSENAPIYANDLTAYDAFMQPVNIWTFRIILLLFVLAAGPGIYLFLKKRDMLEYVWIGIPFLAVCFAAIVFITGIPARKTAPFVRYYSVCCLTEQGTDRKTVFSVTSPDDDPVFFSAGRDMEICSEASADLYAGNTDAMSRTLENAKNSIVMAGSDREIQVMLSGDGLFSSQFFTSHQFDAHPDEDARLKAEITYDNGVVSGFVTNQTSRKLEGVFAACDNIFVKIGTLSPGETKKFEYADAYVYGIDSLMQESFCRSLAEEMDIANPAAMTMQIRDMLMMQDAMTDQSCYIGGFTQETPPVIEGFSPDEVKGVSFFMMPDIRWQAAKGRRMEMIVTGFYDTEDDEGAEITDADDLYPVYYDYSEIPKNYCYQFDTDYIPDHINWLNPEEGASCEWYNVKTGNYDRVFESGKMISGQRIMDYLDASHVLRVRFLGAGEYMVPVFSSFGGKTDD